MIEYEGRGPESPESREETVVAMVLVMQIRKAEWSETRDERVVEHGNVLFDHVVELVAG